MMYYNEGVLEGLKIARVFLKQEMLLSPNSNKLHRLFIEISNAISDEEAVIKKQNEVKPMHDIITNLSKKNEQI